MSPATIEIATNYHSVIRRTAKCGEVQGKLVVIRATGLSARDIDRCHQPGANTNSQKIMGGTRALGDKRDLPRTPTNGGRIDDDG
jgi:hypothetical protein